MSTTPEQESKLTKESKKEFKNTHLKGEVERLPQCKLRFKVHVEPDRVKELRNKALKAVNKEVSIPGFRPGKAPENLVEKQYSKYIDQEFRQKSANQIVQDVIELTNYWPLKRGEGVTLEKFQPNEQGLELIFNFETFPEVPDVDLSLLELPNLPQEEVRPAEIEQLLKEIQLYHAEWAEITDRPVQEGDFVVIDIDVLDEPHFKAYENSRFHVIEKGMPDWARKLVIGLKTGESVEGMSEKDEHSGEHFKPHSTRITVHLIQSANLPPLDDALAKKAGAPTVEELRVNVEKRLESEKRETRQEELRMKARAFLLENYPFDLPATDLKNLDNDCQKLIARDKGNFKTAEELAAYKERLYRNAQGVVRLAYFIPHIAEQLELPPISEQEISKRMMQTISYHYLQTQERIPEDQYPFIYNKTHRDLLQQNVLDKMIEINQGSKV